MQGMMTPTLLAEGDLCNRTDKHRSCHSSPGALRAADTHYHRRGASQLLLRSVPETWTVWGLGTIDVPKQASLPAALVRW